MSASLVGSEMCIRDRWRDAGRASGCRSSVRSRASNRTTDSTEDSLAAVSYTHLTLPTICSV
eukprot:701945-Alexandrium_andersonii.AAC.1